MMPRAAIHRAYTEMLLHDLLRLHKQAQALADSSGLIEPATAATRLSTCIEDLTLLLEQLAPPTPESIALRAAAAHLIAFSPGD